MARLRARSLASVLAALSLGLAAVPASAVPDAMVLPTQPSALLALGTGWDSESGQQRGDPGACVEGGTRERREGGAPTWALLVLSRAGGRLLLGVHVSAPVAVEGVAGARITDAARRLMRSDPEAFGTLCGDGFIAALASGDQYVAEIEVDPRDAPRAAARLAPGAWSQVEPFREALGAVVGSLRSSARELPGGRRAAGQEVEPAEVLARAAAFPEAVTLATGRPYLALYRPYPEESAWGLPIEIDPAEGWIDVAQQVLLADRTRGAASSRTAARAADMRKALVRREGPPDVAPPDRPVAGSRAEPAARVRSMAALVYDDPSGTAVFATNEAPPGVYAERVKKHALWVPGAAVATPAVKQALARASSAAPSRGTTFLVGDGAIRGVVLTDAPPIPGVHREVAGPLHAWIAGVEVPTPAQREAIAAALPLAGAPH